MTTDKIKSNLSEYNKKTEMVEARKNEDQEKTSAGYSQDIDEEKKEANDKVVHQAK